MSINSGYTDQEEQILNRLDHETYKPHKNCTLLVTLLSENTVQDLTKENPGFFKTRLGIWDRIAALFGYAAWRRALIRTEEGLEIRYFDAQVIISEMNAEKKEAALAKVGGVYYEHLGQFIPKFEKINQRNIVFYDGNIAKNTWRLAEYLVHKAEVAQEKSDKMSRMKSHKLPVGDSSEAEIPSPKMSPGAKEIKTRLLADLNGSNLEKEMLTKEIRELVLHKSSAFDLDTIEYLIKNFSLQIVEKPNLLQKIRGKWVPISSAEGTIFFKLSSITSKEEFSHGEGYLVISENTEKLRRYFIDSVCAQGAYSYKEIAEEVARQEGLLPPSKEANQ